MYVPEARKIISRSCDSALFLLEPRCDWEWTEGHLGLAFFSFLCWLQLVLMVQDAYLIIVQSVMFVCFFLKIKTLNSVTCLGF